MQPSLGRCPQEIREEEREKERKFSARWGRRETFLPSTWRESKKISYNMLQKKKCNEINWRRATTLDTRRFLRISNARTEKKELNNEKREMERACNEKEGKRPPTRGASLISLIWFSVWTTGSFCDANKYECKQIAETHVFCLYVFCEFQS